MSAGSIIVYPDSADSYVVELEPGQTLEIGRKPTVTGNRKLIISVPEVSGQHAEIRPTPQGWTIRDSGSTNGTRLNGDRLTPGKEYLLCTGDRLKIANIDLLINLSKEQSNKQAENQEESEEERTHLRINLITATILVGDLRGFTGLTERHAHEPDKVMQVAQLVFACLHEEIRKHHGQLEKIAGDAIMAYWESDESSAVHAFQACYTALRMRAMVKGLATRQEYWPFPDFPLELDMALATGAVAAGALGNAEGNPAILGDTANLAFRLEKLIAPDSAGDIIVDEATYLLVAAHFQFEPLGSFNIKGRQREVAAYRLSRQKESVQ